MTAPYVAALCSPRTQVVFGEDGATDPARLQQNLETYCSMIARAAGEHGARLVAFPQFGVTGYAFVSSQAWIAASLDVSGPEIARLAQAAREAAAYVVVQFAERHAAFPDRYFLSAAILTPEGEVGLTYRKHYTLSLRTSPIDVHDRFVATFGPDAFYPVLDTPLGRLGLCIGAEVHWPEAVRSLALNGAEVVINPIAAAGPGTDYMGRPGAELTRPVRAFENMVYLAMIDSSGAASPPSQAYDFNGGSISRPEDDGFTLATIDIEALRTARAQPAANFLALLQPDIHAPLRELPAWPPNSFPEAPPESRAAQVEVERAAWARLQARWR